MNFHSDEWIMDKINEHLEESYQYFLQDEVVGIFNQGSGNYGLDYEESDIDTKLIIVPSFYKIAMNKQPISTTHFRANDEHIDFKDVRLYMQTFRKQNLNFLEILFTKYCLINDNYFDEWKKLVDAREEIAHMNLHQAVKAMQGVAKEKYHAMEHHYPKRMHMINKYGYDPKQLHHLLRIEDFISRYIAGVPYEECMIPLRGEYLVNVKRGCHSLEEARFLADRSMSNIDEKAKIFLEKVENKANPEMEELLDEVQYNIMKIAVKKELGYGEVERESECCSGSTPEDVWGY